MLFLSLFFVFVICLFCFCLFFVWFFFLGEGSFIGLIILFGDYLKVPMVSGMGIVHLILVYLRYACRFTLL